METCLHCAEPVLPTDRHELSVTLDPKGGLIEERKVHWECAARAVLGSVGHQKGECSCHGGTAEDPPGMTRREAAQAALKYALEHLPVG